jgi:hypothetical protein
LMLSALREASGRLLPSTQKDIQTVEAKLQAARERLELARADQAAAALELALSDDPGPRAAELQRSVDEAAGWVETCLRALEAAHQAEQARIAAAASAAEKSRKRAIRSHGTEMHRRMQAAQAAIANFNSAWRSLVAEAQTLDRLLTASENEMREGLGVAALRRMIVAEMYRVGTENPLSPDVDNYLPGTSKRGLWVHPDDVAPLGDGFKATFASWLDWLNGTAPAPAPVEEPTATAEPEPEPKLVEPPEQPVEPIAEPELAHTPPLHPEPLDFSQVDDRTIALYDPPAVDFGAVTP